MSKKEKDQPVASLNVFEISDDDYRLDLNVKVGGVRIEVSKTVSEIRKFFTERKERRTERQEGKHLQAVPQEE